VASYLRKALTGVGREPGMFFEGTYMDEQTNILKRRKRYGTVYV
jgi:hypothetical protein